MINQQYEVVESNNYENHTMELNVLDDELKKTVKEVPDEHIYDNIYNLPIEDLNIEDHYDIISSFPLQHTTFTLQNKSSLITDDLLDNCDDYIWMNAVVIPDNKMTSFIKYNYTCTYKVITD